MHRLVVLLLCAFFCAQPSWAYMPDDSALLMPQPFQDWKTLETDHFRINYRDEHLPFAQRVAAVAETVYVKLTPRLKWEPKRQIEVVVLDSFDGSNGGATVMPYNRFYIFMNAPVEGELLDNSPWIEQVFTHELVHILHLDQASGAQEVLRNIFGRFFFTFPQIFSPSWVSEGFAVYEETDENKHFGRGQSAFYDAMMRAEYINGVRSFSELSYHGYWGTDWPTGQSYLYGYYFFEFLSNKYSEEKALEYLLNWNNNIIPWRMQARAKQVFGMSAEALWNQFQAYLEEKYQNDPLLKLDVDQHPVVQGGRINANPVWMSNGDFYYMKNDGRNHPSLQKIDAEGVESKVANVTEYQHIDIHETSGVLLSRKSICDNVDVFTDLYRLNDKGRWNQITKCGRYPRMAWSSDGERIAAVRVDRGINQIAILDSEGILLQLLKPLPQGEAIGHISWSKDDKKLVASVRREKTGWNLELLDVDRDLWKPLTNNTHLEQRPKFSADGQSVFFISDHKGSITLRQLFLADGRVETVAQSQTAVLDYSVKGNDVRTAEYTAKGVMIQQQALGEYGEAYAGLWQERPLVQSLVNKPDFDTQQYDKISDYSALDTLAPTSWFALFYADSEDNNWIQFVLNGQDVLGFHTWQFAPAYYFDKSELGGSLGYLAYHRLAFLIDRELETVRDGTDELTSRWDEETRYQAIWTQPFNSFDGTFRVDFGVAKEDLKRVDEDAGVLAKQEDNLAGISFNWNDFERYVHSISAEDGRSIKLQFEHYDFFGEGYYQGEVMSLDWREYIGLFDNHVLALRAVAGKADDEAKPFELGNELDQLQSLGGLIGFGRTGYTLRGYADNHPELSGENLRLYSAEYRLPVGEWFDGFTSFPLGLGKTAVHLFVDHGAAWNTGPEKDYYTGVGFELRPDLLIGYSTFLLQSTLGFAKGLDDELGESSVYLRVGASF